METKKIRDLLLLTPVHNRVINIQIGQRIISMQVACDVDKLLGEFRKNFSVPDLICAGRSSA